MGAVSADPASHCSTPFYPSLDHGQSFFLQFGNNRDPSNSTADQSGDPAVYFILILPEERPLVMWCGLGAHDDRVTHAKLANCLALEVLTGQHLGPLQSQQVEAISFIFSFI